MPDSSKEPAPMVEAQPDCSTRWYFSLGSGHEIDLDSRFSSGHDEFFDFGGGDTADAHFLSRDYNDVFDNWYNVIGEIGYAFTDNFEVFGNFKYTHARSRLVSGSEIEFDFGIPFDLELLSKWDDYTSYGGELGARYYFMRKGSPIRPYVSLSGGATFVDEIDLHVTTEFFGANVVAYDGDFYDSTLTFTGTGMIGVEFNVTCNLAITLDVGLRYQSELDSDDSDFETGSPAVAGIVNQANGQGSFIESALLESGDHLNNSGADRLVVPVTVAVKFKF